MVERFHRQLKAAIRCHRTSRWTERLSTVLLGIRAAWKEMVYEELLRLSGEFLAEREKEYQRTYDDRHDGIEGIKYKARFVAVGCTQIFVCNEQD